MDLYVPTTRKRQWRYPLDNFRTHLEAEMWKQSNF